MIAACDQHALASSGDSVPQRQNQFRDTFLEVDDTARRLLAAVVAAHNSGPLAEARLPAIEDADKARRPENIRQPPRRTASGA